MADEKVIWKGASGTAYEYFLYRIGHKLKAEGGNYIFCKAADAGKWTAVYIGQTSDLDLRFDNHHKAACVQSAGATHICAHLQSDEKKRLAEETDLVRGIKTTCND